MNLTSDPWIPAVRSDGTRDAFSLNDLFAQAHQLRDLAVKPHERIALMRLLLCITQAALDGPKDESDWEECRPLIQPRVKDYLVKWKAKFELFGDGERFLQAKPGILGPPIPAMENEGITRLDLNMASGESNATLFDNAASAPREFSAAQAALSILAYQCYSPLLGRGYKGRSPCADSNMIHTFVIGTSLLETLHLNVLHHETIFDSYGETGNDRPIWEVFNGTPITKDQAHALTTGYIGRLIPMARSIQIESSRSVTLANGLVYDGFRETGYREAAATVVTTKTKKEHILLSARLDRALWRELPAVCVKSISKDDSAGPLALRNPFRSDEITIWSAGIVADQAKIRDVVEASYCIPSKMLDTPGRAAYERGVQHAEAAESALIQAVKSYASELKVASPAYDKARQHFWTRVEQSLSTLFDIARKLTSEAELPGSDWGRAVRAAALDAYQQSCPRQTPRQIQAYALGLRRLNTSPKSKSAEPTKGTSHEQTQIR